MIPSPFSNIRFHSLWACLSFVAALGAGQISGMNVLAQGQLMFITA
jgi:hypothetical protein